MSLCFHIVTPLSSPPRTREIGMTNLSSLQGLLGGFFSLMEADSFMLSLGKATLLYSAFSSQHALSLNAYPWLWIWTVCLFTINTHFCSSFLESREVNSMTVQFSDKWPCVLQKLWHQRQKKKIKQENGRKMTRYGVCLIPERGEVSLPEGLQQEMSWHWGVFLSSLLVRVVVLLYTLLCF